MSYSQTDTIHLKKPDYTTIHFPEIEASFPCLYSVEEMSFSGAIVKKEICGSMALIRFVQENLQYPKAEWEDSISGRVILSFTVLEDGTLTDIKVERSVNPLLDQEAVRLVSIMPKWVPAIHRNEPCASRIMLPITFVL